jgi:hypothetical protein
MVPREKKYKVDASEFSGNVAAGTAGGCGKICRAGR